SRPERALSTRFESTVDIDRPIEEVFAYLADGSPDPVIIPRVQPIEKSSNCPTRVGPVFHITVKDAGMTSRRDFEISELVAPNRIRWHEQSKNLITAAEGGYDLERTPDGGTHVRLFNVLEGHGVGKLLVGFAGSAARKDAPAFG